MLTFPISSQLFIRNISNLTIWYLQNHSQLKPKCGDYNASCLLAKSPGIGVPQTCLNPLSPVLLALALAAIAHAAPDVGEPLAWQIFHAVLLSDVEMANPLPTIAGF